MRTTSSDVADRPDVLVLGGGCAGVLAAHAAKRAGRSVTLVHKAGGATALSSGAVDVADAHHRDVPGPGADPLDAGPGWLLGIERLSRERPRHPYARLGAAAQERMPEALALLEEATPGLDFARREALNLVVATELGTTKRTAMAQASAGLDLAGLAGAGTSSAGPARTVAVADLKDLAGFPAARAAAMLTWIAGLDGSGASPNGAPAVSAQGGRPRFVVVEVPSVIDGPPLSARPLASRFDDEAALIALGEALKSALTGLEPRPHAVLLPAVLGVAQHAKAREVLETATGVAIHEVLAMPPSAPGARLSSSLLAGLAPLDVAVFAGEGLSARVEDRRVVEVTVSAFGREHVLRPNAVVLATGRFLAGGLVRDGRAREPVFGLPVVAEGQLVADRFIGELTAELPDGEHGIFRAGVPWDDKLRPRGADGRALAKNLFAAGSILEGYDPARDASGLGVAALTGLLAGERAARVSA